MNEEIPEWDLVAVERRYDYLQLSDEQAAQVFLYEQETRSPISGGLIFSYWEERDYEWDRMKAILSEEQLALYERDLQGSIEGYEASLRRTDASEWPKEVALFEEMAGWYRETFIPVFRSEVLQVPILLSMEPEKVDYLRTEYTKFLLRTRRDVLVNHYRQSRRHQPNGLRLALLRHALLELWPDFARWFREADAPTQGVAAHVLERYQGYCRMGSEFFRQKEEEIRQQWLIVRTRRTGEPMIPGWHVNINAQQPWSVEELGMMTLLLMDPVRRNGEGEY
jgi:hypothetical protein